MYLIQAATTKDASVVARDLAFSIAQNNCVVLADNVNLDRARALLFNCFMTAGGASGFFLYILRNYTGTSWSPLARCSSQIAVNSYVNFTFLSADCVPTTSNTAVASAAFANVALPDGSTLTAAAGIQSGTSANCSLSGICKIVACSTEPGVMTFNDGRVTVIY